MQYGHAQLLPNHNQATGDPWQCVIEGCGHHGTLRQRSGVTFHRHDCWGHDPERPKEYQGTFYVCQFHRAQFLAPGGAHPEPLGKRGFVYLQPSAFTQAEA